MAENMDSFNVNDVTRLAVELVLKHPTPAAKKLFRYADPTDIMRAVRFLDVPDLLEKAFRPSTPAFLGVIASDVFGPPSGNDAMKRLLLNTLSVDRVLAYAPPDTCAAEAHAAIDRLTHSSHPPDYTWTEAVELAIEDLAVKTDGGNMLPPLADQERFHTLVMEDIMDQDLPRDSARRLLNAAKRTRVRMIVVTVAKALLRWYQSRVPKLQ